MGYKLWIVEAVGAKGQTLWRQIFLSSEAAERLHKKSSREGIHTFWWSM